MASSPERLERFRREARAVAALNHPHIVTIYSVEEEGSVHFLTMELVESVARPSHPRGRARGPADPRDRNRPRRCPRRRARQRHRPPRPQAGECQGDERRTREGSGLRPRQGQRPLKRAAFRERLRARKARRERTGSLLRRAFRFRDRAAGLWTVGSPRGTLGDREGPRSGRRQNA